jgi:hypothetical protein
MFFSEDRELMKELAEVLEENGMVSITDGSQEISIQSVDDKEGYAYISNTNREFDNSREAIKWAFERLNSSENVIEWQ